MTARAGASRDTGGAGILLLCDAPALCKLELLPLVLPRFAAGSGGQAQRTHGVGARDGNAVVPDKGAPPAHAARATPAVVAERRRAHSERSAPPCVFFLPRAASARLRSVVGGEGPQASHGEGGDEQPGEGARSRRARPHLCLRRLGFCARVASTRSFTSSFFY